MPFQPVSKENFIVTPFTTRKSWNISDTANGVYHYYATTSSLDSNASNSLYGVIRNMYGTGCETVFGQKNLTCPNKISVIGITKDIYGDEIVPASFSLQDNYHSPTVVNIEDDGKGNLWDSDYKGSLSGGCYIFNGSGSIQALFGECSPCVIGEEDFMVELLLIGQDDQRDHRIINRRAGAIGWEILTSGVNKDVIFLMRDNASNTAGNVANTSFSIVDGTLHHLVSVFNKDENAIFYLDNVSGPGTGFYIGNISASISSTANLSIGNPNAQDPAKTYSGSIKQIRFYNFGSGGLSSSLSASLSDYIAWNYLSGSVHAELKPYLKEEWNWVSGSSKTGSISGSILSVTGSPHYRSSQIVGNMFYTNGLCVFTETENPPYVNIGSGTAGTGYEIDLMGTMRYNELRVECVSPAGVQNMTTNPTAIWGTGSNVSMSGTSSWEYRYHPMQSYVTKIGLYNSDYQLLGIGNLAQPIQKDPDTDLVFVCKIDI